MEKRRVVITGVGIVSCLGHDDLTVLEALSHGRSGVRAVPIWQEKGLKSWIAGALHGVDEKIREAKIPKKLAPGMSASALYCSVAAIDAVADAGLESDLVQDPTTGCLVGSGIGDVNTVHGAGILFDQHRVRRIDPYTVLRAMSSSASSAVTNLLGIRGRSYSLSSACATSAHNIGHAFELIQGGLLNRAVAGGGEEVDELTVAGFQALRLALSTRSNNHPEQASRPYDRARDGFVVSGGAGIVILEEREAARKRGAEIRAEIVGHGANADGFDLVLPRPDGSQAGECIRAAISAAALEPTDIDYVNTHGTATVHGDLAEVEALRKVFGSEIPCFSSTKSMTGHSLGAAGALELIFCVLMLEHGFMAPSINIDDLDPAFAELPIVQSPTGRPLRTVLSNNFGFGGTNCSLVICRDGI